MIGTSNGRNNFAPMNIMQNDNVYRIELALPGWSKEDIQIEVEDDTLKISGEKSKDEFEKDQTIHRQEFYTNRFFRSVILNESVNQRSEERRVGKECRSRGSQYESEDKKDGRWIERK